MALMQNEGRQAQAGDGGGTVPLIQDPERLLAVLGGGTLAYLGWQRRDEALGMTMLALGGALVLHGATGYPQVAAGRMLPERLRRLPYQRGWVGPVTVQHSVTIGKPRHEIYRFWRDFSNLARFMDHVERIDVLADDRSHWVVRAPMGRTVEWDALVENDQENERIAWRSAEGADVPNSGVVTFRDAPGGRGTEVHVTINYEPPAGQAGRAVAWLVGEEPMVQLRDSLRQLKQLLETGEVTRVEDQPAGERSRWGLGT